MPSITAQGLCWTTATGQNIIDNISISLGKEKTGLVGPNGSGKTTLVRLLIGELQPASGTVQRFGRIGYLPQSFELNPNATVSDVLRIAEPESSIAARIQLSRLGLHDLQFDRPLREISGGQTTKVLLAGLMLSEPQFIILDEPTNNLDLDSRYALYEFIQKWPRGALVVSHDRALLEHVDQIAELFSGSLKIFGGNYASYAAQQKLEDEAAERHVTNAKQSLRKVLTTARQSLERQNRRTSRAKKVGARSGQAKIILKTLKSKGEQTTSRLIAVFERKIEHAEHNLEEARQRIRPQNRVRLDLSGVSLPRGKVISRLEDVYFTYGRTKNDPVLAGFSLNIMGRERIAFTGPNGCGKTTLLRLIAGELEPQYGSIVRGVSRIAYLPQNTLLLDNSGTLLSNFQRLSEQYDDNTAREMLSGFLFYGLDSFKPVEALSGGERLRVALAGVLCRRDPPDLLILDEPTNHLDLDTIEQIESALQQYPGTLILVSHDQTFITEVGIEREITLAQA
jgi:ATPase subunit of ABC transporter with duplicated ATPase domains